MTRLCTSSAASFIVFAAPSPMPSAPPIPRTGRVSRRSLRRSFCDGGVERAIGREAVAQGVGIGGEGVDVVPHDVVGQFLRGFGQLEPEVDVFPPGDELLVHLGEPVEGEVPQLVVGLGAAEQRWRGPSLSDLHETTGTYEISVVKQGETGPLRL